jgi:hypothetical protein
LATAGYAIARDLLPASVTSAFLRAYHTELDRRIDCVRRMHACTLPPRPDVEPGVRNATLEQYYGAIAARYPKELGGQWRTCMAMKAAVYDLARTPELVAIMKQLMGGEIHGHAEFNHKPKMPRDSLLQGGGAWHQDGFYFGEESVDSTIVGCWIPLIPVTKRNGCLQVVARSHLHGYLPHEWHEREGQGFFEIASPIDARDIVTCPMRPGDVLLLRQRTAHRGLPNRSATIRWSVDIRYIRGGDSAGATHFDTPEEEWVIDSERRPATSLDAWTDMIARTNALGGPTRGVMSQWKTMRASTEA